MADTGYGNAGSVGSATMEGLDRSEGMTSIWVIVSSHTKYSEPSEYENE